MLILFHFFMTNIRENKTKNQVSYCITKMLLGKCLLASFFWEINLLISFQLQGEKYIYSFYCLFIYFESEIFSFETCKFFCQPALYIAGVALVI